MFNEIDDDCPARCGGSPRWGCNCRDDGEQYRVPRTQYPDADRARRRVKGGHRGA